MSSKQKAALVVPAKLNCHKLQRLAEAKIEESRILLQYKHWTGAYYEAGLAVECALKARLSRAIQQYDFPYKKFVDKAYTHDLEDLVELDPALSTELRNEMSRDDKLESNWKTASSWDDEKRYELVEESEARSLFDAITEPSCGVMDWIRRRW
ncbi:MAG: DNA-binding protein [Terriglobia bacterium]